MWPACESEDWLSKHLTPIRHQISKVPPYNYTGIDQNINVIFGSSDGSTPFYVTDSGDNTKELDKNEVSVYHVIFSPNKILNSLFTMYHSLSPTVF